MCVCRELLWVLIQSLCGWRNVTFRSLGKLTTTQKAQVAGPRNLLIHGAHKVSCCLSTHKLELNFRLVLLVRVSYKFFQFFSSTTLPQTSHH